MDLRSATDWLTWGALVLPLASLAWSAWQYVAIQKREEARQRFDNLFRVMEKIGEQGGSIAAKMAAVNELRKYPEYKDLIVRLCNDAAPRVVGENASMLRREFELTAAHFGNGSN
ncbi:MAG: hypothetical protein H6916_12765 [Novosphingobium sp.]|uniref:tetratricopeptide repeat protein n=1 Tax=Novosphingobium sp. TaxID=1874826 RepID=UPI00261B1CA8|nr:tetratricopeptide repeat protein [Novosphingobium sp.]MCP5387667.1 hypothetical protein [Novosphingobium sp.]